LTLAEGDNGLILIGTGVGSLSQMPICGVDAAARSAFCFLEGYTSIFAEGDIRNLEEKVGTIEVLRREEVENPVKLLSLAKESLVSLFVVGDPLQATTHVDLLLRCHDDNIPTEVIHASSVTTLVSGGLGLQNYRFGRQVTLAFPVGDYLPTSPLEMLCEGNFLGNHVLILFDLDPTASGDVEPIPMTPEQAVLILELMAQKLRNDWPPHLDGDDVKTRLRAAAIKSCLERPIREWFGILCSDLGSRDQRIRRGSLGEIANLAGGKIHCMVIPGELQGLEAEAVEKLIIPL